MRSKHSIYRDEEPIVIKKAALTVRSSLPVFNSSQLTDRNNPTDRISLAEPTPAKVEERKSIKREFEKFDFSEI